MEAKTKKIAGHTYVVTPFPGRLGGRLHTRLVRAIGPGIASIAGAATKPSKSSSVLDADIDGSAMAAGIERLFANLGDDAAIGAFTEELLQFTRRDGNELTPEHMDLAYAGNLLEMYKALLFVIEVNYGDFFGGVDIGSLGGLLKARIADTLAASKPDSTPA